MGKKTGFLLLVLLIGMMAGCKKEEKQQIELLPAAKEQFCYEGTEGASGIAVDEEGLLYTMRYIPPEDDGPRVMEEGMEPIKSYQEVLIYDLEGNCLKSKVLEVGNGRIYAMVVKDGVIYCINGKSMYEYAKVVLFAVDTKDWTVTTVTELPDFRSIECMTLIEDYLYLLGETKAEQFDPAEAEALDEGEYKNRNHRICRFSITAEYPVAEWMNVEFPRELYRTEQDTLMIYRYSKECGYGFLEFDPEQVTLTERGWDNTNFYDEISGCREGILYNDISYDCVHYLYYMSENGEKAQILPEEVFLWAPCVYRKGFVFFVNWSGKNCVERVCIENVLQKDKALQLLTEELIQDTLFSCGFVTEEQLLDAESFALKVLARDSDFDLFLLNSRSSVSYNIKENGVFYPLNEVEGVQEYLDACFPYVKELATDDEGNIWMLPVRPAIFGLLYNKSFCEENDVDYAQMDWREFLEFTSEVRAENEERINVSTYMLKEQFFGQYLSKYDTFDTEEFRTCAKQFRDIVKEQGEWLCHFFDFTSPEEMPEKDFYYDYIVYSNKLEEYKDALGDSDAIGIVGAPKLSEDIGNVGVMTFLAVNPESDNLETALDYISAFAKYMVTKQDSYLLADESMYTDTPLIKDAYELYANAEVYFQMDANVYWHDFTSYLNGETELEEMIAEIERKYQLYIGE